MTSWIPKMTTWVFSSVVKGKFLQLLNLMLVQTWMTGKKHKSCFEEYW